MIALIVSAIIAACMWDAGIPALFSMAPVRYSHTGDTSSISASSASLTEIVLNV